MTTWAAVGEARDVTVDVPERLEARPSGSVHLVQSDDAGGAKNRLIDGDSMTPTREVR